MRNLMEKQNSSWFALLLTAFYSVVASSRAEECGHEELTRCARPLQQITQNNDLSFFPKKEELERLCPKLEDSVKCINSYTLKCLKEKQRDHFNSLYAGTNMAIRELCQEGPYQDAFLEHVPCMQKKSVKIEYEKCSTAYQNGLKEMGNSSSLSGHGAPATLKTICCSFQAYLDCSHNVVLKECGQEAAEFTKGFLDRMSNSLKENHCKTYPLSTCPGNSASLISFSRLLLPVLILLSRYFT
ncbi:uncharacterized protein LOC117176031 [Belonocnema kinseyi]|uniref:uncharacterized protein LOC117176031 n=1 Tax=Belonocnema kinseyi TaxID=2817044 RepID=UPI00143CC743|nr:uncharacterized protein LOC117176031 [Belonocnema kinseyi]